MDNKDWYDCGRKIGDLVNDAVENSDFQKLNQSIADTINDTLDAISRNLVQQQKMQRQAQQAVKDRSSWSAEGNLYQSRTRVTGKSGRSLQGTFQMMFGGVMAVMFGSMALVSLVPTMMGYSAFGFSTVVMTILCAGFAYMSAGGRKTRKLSGQAEKYLEAMRGRDTITVEELAAATGNSVKTVQNDLRTMIKRSVFSGSAYLDEQGTTFMTSREAFKQYQDTMKAYRQRRAEAQQAAAASKAAGKTTAKAAPTKTEQAAKREKAEENMAAYSDETRGILQEGNAFIAHIHKANDWIEDETVSEKLDRLENVVTRIFEQVAADPESASDLHRLMSYYLPITKKLVDAYIELDKQQVDGENITKMRSEITASLDTINDALEVLLDGMFRDKAWDIETDIATLRTMIAHDGLAEEDFKMSGSSGKSMTAADGAAAGMTSAGGGAAAGMAFGEQEQKHT